MTTDETLEVRLRVSRFEHSDDPAMTGMRGVKLDAATPYSGRALSAHFPTLFFSDDGAVEVGDLVVPGPTAVAWFRAVSDYIDKAEAERA